MGAGGAEPLTLTTGCEANQAMQHATETLLLQTQMTTCRLNLVNYDAILLSCGAVYCNRSCLCVYGFVCSVTTITVTNYGKKIVSLRTRVRWLKSCMS